MGNGHPTQRDINLVKALATGLEAYHGERPGNFACWMQAAEILCEKSSVFLGRYEPVNFIKTTKYTPDKPSGEVIE